MKLLYCLAFLLIIGFSQGAITDQLEFYISCDGNFSDSSIYGHHPNVTVAVSNITYKKFGTGSCYFDGSGDYLEWNDATWNSPTTGDISFCSWTSFNDNARANGHGLLTKGPFTSSHGNWQFFITGGVTNYPAFRFSTTELNYPVVIPLKTWQHYCYVFNNSANTVNIYRNGTLVDENSFTSDLTNTADKLRAGMYYASTHSTYGYMDEIIFFSRKITGSEVYQLFTGYNPYNGRYFNGNITVSDYSCGNVNISLYSNMDYHLVNIDSVFYLNTTKDTFSIDYNFTAPGEHTVRVSGYIDSTSYGSIENTHFYNGPGYCLTEDLYSTVNTEVLMVWLVLLYIAAVASTLFMPGIVAIPSALFAGAIAIYAYTEQGQTFWILGALLPMGFMFMRGKR